MAYRSHFFFVLSLGTMLGCGQSNRLPTVPVTGTITMDGDPVAGAEVSFLPKKPTVETKPAKGITDAQGRYELATYLSPKNIPKGAMPGEYDVTIIRLATDDRPTRPGGRGDVTNPAVMHQMHVQMSQKAKAMIATGEQGAEAAKASGPGTYGQEPPESLLPRRYSNPDRSGLQAAVKAGQINNYDFPLTE